ncbi:MAG: hypothetical protein KF696_07195 [Planctomycetes bacterium]|nr:hypothetical protein [Planctomycetota bacterium]MCW8135340.1 hypothetical protein [Planctomycetota bacterium]
MNKLLLAMLCCGVVPAQEVPEFADDDALAEIVDVRRVADSRPGEQFVLSPSGWCVAFDRWSEKAILWQLGKEGQAVIEYKSIVEAQITDAGDWVALRSSGQGVALYRVTGGKAARVLECAASACVLDGGGALFAVKEKHGWQAHRLSAGRAEPLIDDWPEPPQSLELSGVPGVLSAVVETGTQYWQLHDEQWRVVARIPSNGWTMHMALDRAFRFALVFDMDAGGATLVWLKDGKADGKPEPLAHGGLCALAGDELFMCGNGKLSAFRVNVERRSVTRQAAINLSFRVTALAHMEGNAALLGSTGFWTWSGRNADVTVKVGGDAVRWVAEAEPFTLAVFPQVEWSTTFRAARHDASHIDLTVTARNAGKSAQARLVADLECYGAAGGPARVYLGAVDPGESVVRRVKLRLAEKGAAVGKVRLTPRQLGTRAWGAHEWAYLPMITRNADEFDVLARKIHDEALSVLSDITGRKIEARLELMPPGFLGFVAGTDAKGNPRVGYMNAWKLTDEAKAGMMVLMHSDDIDNAMRNMEALTWSYLCHEAVHIARRNNVAMWHEEYIANMIQPWLLRRVMERLKAPYSARDIERLLERIATSYRATLDTEFVQAVDAYAARDGDAGKDPFQYGVWDLFERDTGAYIYFSARINAHSMAQETTLERLCAKYLTKAGKQED